MKKEKITFLSLFDITKEHYLAGFSLILIILGSFLLFFMNDVILNIIGTILFVVWVVTIMLLCRVYFESDFYKELMKEEAKEKPNKSKNNKQKGGQKNGRTTKTQ